MGLIPGGTKIHTLFAMAKKKKKKFNVLPFQKASLFGDIKSAPRDAKPSGLDSQGFLQG